MKQGRERKRLSLPDAATYLGITNGQYLCRCENGISNFPTKSLKRALDLYKIPVATAVEAAVNDFQASMVEFLRK